MATQTTITDYPDFMKPYLEDVLKEGQDLYDTDTYTPYTEPRIAGFTKNQKDIMDKILAYDGQDAGIKALQDSFYTTDADGNKVLKDYEFTPRETTAQSFLDTDAEGNRLIDQYMNPYEDLVVDKMRRQTDKNMALQRAKDMANAVGRGAFGSSREAAQTAVGQQALLDRLANAEADLFYKGYGQAANIFSKDADRKLKADSLMSKLGLEADKLGMLGDFNRASALESLAKTDQQLFADEMALKGSVGDAEQKMNQASLDLAYDDFLRQEQFPYQQLDFYNSIVKGLTPNIGAGSVTNQTKDPSFLQQALGLGINALGLYGMGGGFKPGGFDFGNFFS